MALFKRIADRIKREINLNLNHRRVIQFGNSIPPTEKQGSRQPVIFFNASTRLSGLSQNAGYSLISSLALKADGIPVVQLVCESGMSHCVLGTDNNHLRKPPPCPECIRTSRLIFDQSSVRFLKNSRDALMNAKNANLGLKDLLNFKIGDFPVGKLILPSMRWILRRHHLSDDEDTCYLAREYIQSAWSLKKQFEEILSELNPLAVVVFNGVFFPEATLRWVAQARGIPVYSHEVGMLPLSAFFTDQEATAYPVQVDHEFHLSEDQNQILDEYLSKRAEGKFVTAGIKFWPEMKNLDKEFWKKADGFQSIVPVFTNVVFDTSQSHANILFDHMFQWLNEVLEAINTHSEVLFVIRAHPDELRPGKESRETVADWIASHQVDQLSNVIFVPSNKFISSYDLIRHAKFVMVYNSTVGLEASIMSKPVLCAGKARYTLIPTVFFPQTRKEYIDSLEKFLNSEIVENPEEFRLNARRVLYSQLFRASLPFDDFLEEDSVWRGYVRIKEFSVDDLSPEKSSTIQVILNGVKRQDPFIRNL